MVVRISTNLHAHTTISSPTILEYQPTSSDETLFCIAHHSGSSFIIRKAPSAALPMNSAEAGSLNDSGLTHLHKRRHQNFGWAEVEAGSAGKAAARPGSDGIRAVAGKAFPIVPLIDVEGPPSVVPETESITIDI